MEKLIPAPYKPNQAISNVFLEFEVDGSNKGRVEFELFDNDCPKTAENFRCLCTGEMGIGKKGKLLHYKGSKIHRIIPGFVIQGGDITSGNGTDGESIYGECFGDENFIYKHDKPYMLAMANLGEPDTNNSQFYITMNALPYLDDHHVVFGKAITGEKVLQSLMVYGDVNGGVERDIRIVDSGESQRYASKFANNVQVVSEDQGAPDPPKEIDMDGYKVPTQFGRWGVDLQLNGSGFRSKWFFTLYLGSLYLQTKTRDAKKVMNDDLPMMIQLEITSSFVTKDKLIQLLEEGFKMQTGGEMGAYEERLKQYREAWKDEIVATYSIMHLLYKPGTGMECYHNKKLICTIPGLDFKRIYYGIWFGDKPCQQSLKDDMLGNKS